MSNLKERRPATSKDLISTLTDSQNATIKQGGIKNKRGGNRIRLTTLNTFNASLIRSNAYKIALKRYNAL